MYDQELVIQDGRRLAKPGEGLRGKKLGGAELPHAQAKQLFSDLFALCHDSAVVAYSKWTTKSDKIEGGSEGAKNGDGAELAYIRLEGCAES